MLVGVVNVFEIVIADREAFQRDHIAICTRGIILLKGKTDPEGLFPKERIPLVSYRVPVAEEGWKQHIAAGGTGEIAGKAASLAFFGPMIICIHFDIV